MIISVLSQKGGAGKSTLARGIAVEYIKAGWDVQVADMDVTQQSTVRWSERRDELKIKPSVETAMYRTPTSAIKAESIYDLLIVDGTPYATQDTLKLAEKSDLIVIPTGVTYDDLEPSLKLGQELALKAEVDRSKILFVVMKVPESGEKEAMSSKKSIKGFGFQVVDTWMPFKTAYGKAMDSGYSMSETRFASLNEKAGNILEAIANHVKTEESEEV